VQTAARCFRPTKDRPIHVQRQQLHRFARPRPWFLRLSKVVASPPKGVKGAAYFVCLLRSLRSIIRGPMLCFVAVILSVGSSVRGPFPC
jgi:hypothetical protein